MGLSRPACAFRVVPVYHGSAHAFGGYTRARNFTLSGFYACISGALPVLLTDTRSSCNENTSRLYQNNTQNVLRCIRHRPHAATGEDVGPTCQIAANQTDLSIEYTYHEPGRPWGV